MTPIEFRSAKAERSPATGTVVLALFDGHPVPNCVALLECEVEAAVALREELGSVLEVPGSTDV